MNKMSFQKRAAIAVLTCLSLSSAVLHAEDAAVRVEANKLVIDKDSIKVWTFQNSNNPAFNYRATTILNTKLSTVVALIMDTRYLPSWVPYTRKVDVIEMDNATGDFVLRLELDFPFPLSDRDVVVKGNMTQQKDGSVLIANKAIVDARVPERSGLVRVKNYEGRWMLKPVGKNNIEVTATGFADPAGHLPLSIVNMFVQKQPFQMFKQMHQEVKKPAYQNVTVPRIIDPVY